MQDDLRFDVSEPLGPRDRLTAFARPLLAIPHALLVGGPALGLFGGGYRMGALGLLAFTVAFLDWCAVIFTGRPLEGLAPMKTLYLRWRARVLAYSVFLRDEYPPFGDGAYPASIELTPRRGPPDRLKVALRPLLAIPHLIVLAVLSIAWIVVCVVSWGYILVRGRLSPRLWSFSREMTRYTLTVESYLLLVSDAYPALPWRAPLAEPATA